MAPLGLVEGSPEGNEDAGLRLDEFTQHLLSSGRAKRTAASYRTALGAFVRWAKTPWLVRGAGTDGQGCDGCKRQRLAYHTANSRTGQ
jgi:hypothetical protein